MALLAPCVASCSAGTGSDAGRPGHSRQDSARADGHPQRAGETTDLPRGVDVAGRISKLLSRRVVAVRTGQEVGVSRDLGGSAAFRAAQRTWFANLRQLPVQRFALSLQPASLVRTGDTYAATVTSTLQLVRYDVHPVRTQSRYRFSEDRGRFRLVSVTDQRWERSRHATREPWQTEPVVVRERGNVLGIFDAGSASQAGRIVTAVNHGLADVAARVPEEWNRHVVVYALSDASFLDTLPAINDDTHSIDPTRVDALTFPVPSRPGGPLASTRFVLSPGVVEEPGVARDRLIRHELTHVALGGRDDHLPVWLSEGIAEWVSVQALPPERRLLSRPALAAARAGVRAMPDDAHFNGPDAQANYGIAWFACEYVASHNGDPMLWELVDQVGRTDNPADADRAVHDLLGLSPDQLARRAGQLILATYAPSGHEDQPSDGPSSANASPTE